MKLFEIKTDNPNVTFHTETYKMNYGVLTFVDRDTNDEMKITNFTTITDLLWK